MRTKALPDTKSESGRGLYLLSAVLFIVIYGLPVLAWLLAGAVH